MRVIHDRQREQVVKEYYYAIHEGDLDRAQRIRQANPDVFPPVTQEQMDAARERGFPS